MNRVINLSAVLGTIAALALIAGAFAFTPSVSGGITFAPATAFAFDTDDGGGCGNCGGQNGGQHDNDHPVSKPLVVAVHVSQNVRCDWLKANPDHLNNPGNVKLSWETTNANTVTINHGIGAVSKDGSRTVHVSKSTTFTLTAKSGSRTDTCQVSVTVKDEDDDDEPICKFLRVSDDDIDEDDRIKLSWETKGGTRLEIEDNHGDEIYDTTDDDKVDDGSVYDRPDRDTRYTLTVWDSDGDKDTCTESVDVDEDDDDDDDDIVITTIRDRQPLTAVRLTEVPYTGFDAGPVLTALFYALLALWSLGVAYVLIMKRGSVFGFSLDTLGFAPRAALATAGTATAFAPVNLPAATDEDENVEEEDGNNTPEEEKDMIVTSTDEEKAPEEGGAIELENQAYRESILLSPDALAVIMAAAATLPGRKALLATVIARAKGSYPREDGWISLNRERMSALFA